MRILLSILRLFCPRHTRTYYFYLCVDILTTLFNKHTEALPYAYVLLLEDVRCPFPFKDVDRIIIRFLLEEFLNQEKAVYFRYLHDAPRPTVLEYEQKTIV